MTTANASALAKLVQKQAEERAKRKARGEDHVSNDFLDENSDYSNEGTQKITTLQM